MPSSPADGASELALSTWCSQGGFWQRQGKGTGPEHRTGCQTTERGFPVFSMLINFAALSCDI